MARLTSLLLNATIFLLISCNVVLAEEHEEKGKEMVAEVSIGERVLTLWTKALPRVPLSGRTVTPEIVEKIPQPWFVTLDRAFRRGNKVYYILESMSKDANDISLVWLAYFQDMLTFPKFRWLAGLVRHPERDETFVVIAKSVPGRVRVLVYRITLPEEAAGLPPVFDPAGYLNWPEPSTPLVPHFFGVIDLLGEPCGISGIELSAQRDGLMIYGERDAEYCPPVFIHLNLETGEWSNSPTFKEDEE